MSNKFDEMRDAVTEAKEVFRAADSVARDMAMMLTGRLRKVDTYWLKMLKRELRSFNMHTGRWE